MNGYTGYSSQQQQQQQQQNGGTMLRRRQQPQSTTPSSARTLPTPPSSASAIKKLDILFPKVDSEYTVQTHGGGVLSVAAYVLIGILMLVEIFSYGSQNASTVEHVQVDTRLGQRMRVNLNITFPSLACVDLHLDVMDVAGDSQLDVDDTLVKQSLSGITGKQIGTQKKAESNQNHVDDEKRKSVLAVPLPENYCGPCFGAHSQEEQCCNTCDDVLEAYRLKGWSSDTLVKTAEQCIREGRDTSKANTPKMTKGQGCNLSGYMVVNRCGGNFHIAMGQGLERNGRHIHTFDPEDTHNFNASHIIHNLSFGPVVDSDTSPLNGVTKIVTKEKGTTGLFQYFIKVVPTTFTDKKTQEQVATNRYFFTERFRPLMKEYIREYEELSGKAQAHAGGSSDHHNDHHHVKNAILPGVFFIYEIYPFQVQVSPVSVPLTHLLIRLFAVVGGVLTVFGWVANTLHDQQQQKQRRSY